VSERKPAGVANGIWSFGVIWFGQFVSLIGSGLTGFALGVWVLLQTGSVTLFAFIALFTVLPGVLISPVAGALVDRWDRRWAMIVSDTGAGLATAAVALLLYTGRLEVWHIYIATGVSSLSQAFQWPAYAAATTLLVPKRHFGRASGLIQGAQASAQILSPLLAGVLVGIIGIYGVLFIDFATFLFAVVALLAVRVPRPEPTTAGLEGRGSLWREAAFGWTYIHARPGLLALLIFFAGGNFFASIAQIAYTPLVLSFAGTEALGTVLSAGGVGMLGGSIIMSAWGGPRRRIHGVLAFWLFIGFGMMIAGARASVALIAASVFAIATCVPIVNGCSQALWQVKTPPDIQGRVFATRRMIAWSTPPLAYLAAGPLADRIFGPLLEDHGLLAGSVGRLIGAGPGRGLGLLLIVLGLAVTMIVFAGYLYPRLRLVEEEVPDAVEG